MKPVFPVQIRKSANEPNGTRQNTAYGRICARKTGAIRKAVARMR